MRILTSGGQRTARQAGQARARPGRGKAGKRQVRAGRRKVRTGTKIWAGEGTGAIAVAGKMERWRKWKRVDRTGQPTGQDRAGAGAGYGFGQRQRQGRAELTVFGIWEV